MKRCTICKGTKDPSQFHRNRLTSDGLQSQCNQCAMDLRRIRRMETKQRLVNALGGKCAKCGYNRCLAALEFHHERDDKEFEISALQRGATFERLLAEARKCIVLCANCHREEHAVPLPLVEWQRRSEVRHGTPAGYRRCTEKCEACMKAWREYHVDLRRKHRSVEDTVASAAFLSQDVVLRVDVPNGEGNGL